MQIHHIATVADWRAAQRDRTYATSTYGRSLQEEGFIHAARRDQVRAVFERYYGDVGEPLVLLTIETERLDGAGVEWREEQVGDQTYPHIYGALPLAAVVRATTMTKSGVAASFTEIFLKEALTAAVVLLLAMFVSVAGVAIGQSTGNEWGPFLGGIIGLVVGGAAALWFIRRRGVS